MHPVFFDRLTGLPTRDWLKARARASPQALALIIGDGRWTYEALDRQVDGLCAWLGQVDLPDNRRVAMILPNGLAAVSLVYACVRLGLVLVPINTRLTGGEIAAQLDQTGCELVLVENLAEAPPGVGEALRVLSLPPMAALAGRSWDSALAEGAPAEQAIVFTSGTTGRPKAVPITFVQHFYSAVGSAFRLGVLPEDIWLSVLPLYHVGGLAVLFRSCLYGTAVDLHSRFDLEAVAGALATRPITLISLVPTMLVRLLEIEVNWPGSLRLILLGGAATTPDLVKAATSRGLNLAVSYGMTEAASQIATLMPKGVRRKPGCVGRPLLFGAVRVVGEDGQPAAVGESGEIQVTGPTVAASYLDDPALNAARYDAGWLRTGDIGYLDEDGDLWPLQRRSDLIISGGENISPAEVEAVLRSHPGVWEVCVVGLGDREWGQRVAALVEPAVVDGVTAGELEAFCRSRLAGFKVPRIIFFDELPRTASGKVVRREVIEKIREFMER